MKNDQGSVLPMYILIIPFAFLLLTIVVDISHVFIARQALKGVADGAAAAVIQDSKASVHGKTICTYANGKLLKCEFVEESVEVKIADGNESTGNSIANKFVNMNTSALKGFKNIKVDGTFYDRSIDPKSYIQIQNPSLPIYFTPKNTYKVNIQGDIPVILLGALGRVFGKQENIKMIHLNVYGEGTPKMNVSWVKP